MAAYRKHQVKTAVDAIVSQSPAKLSKKIINAEMQIADDVTVVAMLKSWTMNSNH